MKSSFFMLIANKIIKTPQFEALKQYEAHLGTSIYEHAIEVASLAYKYSLRHHLNIDPVALIRGGLLHDYYFYDWHIKEKSHRWHGFKHAKTALSNAQRDFNLSKKEMNIIKSHMFPLNIFSWPRSKEAWLITITDKKVAFLEIFRKNKQISKTK